MSTEDTTFDTLIRAAARAPSVSGDPSSRAVKKGDLIGGTFRIEAELGRGGMGIVYQATDLTLGRQVALKIMFAERWPQEARPHLLEIFDREARATAKLSHPSIVSLYYAGDDGGLFFLVLELLRGESLQARIDRALPTSSEAADIIEQILQGLIHAHEHGILHRDLKPQNVFVCDDGRVRLLDFGLASLQDRVADKNAIAMSKGGTPSYMAPEQWQGGAQDARTDLWAVGMILYRMLSSTSIVPPGNVEALRADLPVDDLDPSLAEVVRRATSYEASARYSTAREMLAALRDAIGRSRPSLPAEPGAASAPIRARSSRLGRLRWLIAALIAVVIAGVTVAWDRLRPTPAPIPLRDLPGAYGGHFGRMQVRVNRDGTVWGAYSHDTGFVQAELRGDRLVGWWCELPSRQPPGDAGEFEMQVSRNDRGQIFLDGRYRYGRVGQWDETWNMTGTADMQHDLVPRLEVMQPPCSPGP
jgi:eukaryotic-like serine/threonine-protein kinase